LDKISVSEASDLLSKLQSERIPLLAFFRSPRLTALAFHVVGRNYRPWQYPAQIHALERQAIPGAAIPDSTNHFFLVNTLGESELDSACPIE
jgi:hypothetical protein